MSRRREAADLALALRLSTQEATHLSHISPHTLSSYENTSSTSHSKEMELREVGVGLGIAGMPPLITTVRPGEVMKAPESSLGFETSTGTGSGSAVEGIRGSHTTTRTGTGSVINSFTPSSNDRGIPAPSSSNLPNPSVLSNAHNSSPILALPPRLSNDKSASSSSSSHRPLFSPTQTSKTSDPRTSSTAKKPLTTYGKTDRTSLSPRKAKPGPSSDTRKSVYRLSSSPVGGPVEKRRKTIHSSDDEVEEEVEERDVGSSKSKVEVLLPSREKPTPKKMQMAETEMRTPRSPDPLDGLSRRKTPTSSALKTHMTKNVDESQLLGESVSGPSRRISSRVADHKAKEIAETEERRRRRREDRAKREAAKSRGELPTRNSTSDARDGKGEAPTRGTNSAEEPIVIDESLPPVKAISKPMTPATRANPKPISIPTSRSRTSKSLSDELPPTPQPDLPIDLSTPPKLAREHIHSTATLDPLPGMEHAEPKKRKKAHFADDEVDDLASWSASDEEDYPPKKKKAVAKKEVKKGKEKKQPVRKGGKEKETGASDKLEENTSGLSKPVGAVVDQADEFEDSAVEADKAIEQEEAEGIAKGKAQDKPSKGTLPPTKSPSPDVVAPSPPLLKSPTPPTIAARRSPLIQANTNTNTNTPSTIHRPSPGPQLPNGSLARPGGIKWKTSRSDLSSVLSKYAPARQSGMSKKLRIAPLHLKIGPPVKALPPPPPKAVRKKKGDESDDEEEEEEEEVMTEDEEGNLVLKIGGVGKGGGKKGKGKGMEWFMVED